MLHSILTVIHTITGVVALIVGLWFMYRLPKRSEPGILFQLYLGSLVLMAAALIAVVVLNWPLLATLPRALFVGLEFLAVYTLYEGLQAQRVLQSHTLIWRLDFIDHIGFTVTLLLVGFILITAMGMNVSVWLVAAGGFAAILVGRIIVNFFKHRVVSLPTV